MSNSGTILSAEHLLFMIQKKRIYIHSEISCCVHMPYSEEIGLERMQVVICTH